MISSFRQSVPEFICDVANNYNITPKRVLLVYNKAVEKDYVFHDIYDAMNLTERFVRRYYAFRGEFVKKPYVTETIYQFSKTSWKDRSWRGW